MTTNITPIEQEFFEAFGIEPIRCVTESLLTIGHKCEQDYDDYVKRQKSKGLVNILEFIYPPITPEIERKLEEIIIKKYFSFGYAFDEKVKFKWCAFYAKDIKTDEVLCFGKTRQEALLNLCIQLKDEIKEEVKECFRWITTRELKIWA